VSEPRPHTSRSWSPALAQRIEQACTRFEAAWKAGQRPALGEFLRDTTEPERSELLRELLGLVLAYCPGRAEPPALEEYLVRFAWDVEGARTHGPHAVAPAPRRLDQFDGRETVPVAPGQATGEDPRRTAAYFPASPAAGERCAPPAAQLPSIPGYQVLDVLGKGGMGMVYRARHLRLDRLVALKTILAKPQLGEESLNRFLREARAVARLRHPNIVQIYEISECGERPYLALEFVEGGGLDKQLAGTPRPPRAAGELVEVLARAMQHAHHCQVVHRDLKPANVLMTAHGVPKITDFGLAKQLDADGGETRPDMILGTPSYMAPEQAAGKAGECGPPADVYALGAILYELLTGRPPFKGASWQDTLEHVRSQEPVPPSRLQPNVPRDLQTICLKCLEKDAGKRYASAEALADDLRRFLINQPILARPARVWERAFKWAKRRPAVAALAGALIGISVLAFGLVTWEWWEASRQRRRAERLVVRLSLDRAQSLGQGGDVGRGMLWLANALDNLPEGSAELEQAVRASLVAWHRQLHPLHHLFAHPAPVARAAFSPDGSTILTVSTDRRVRLWEAATGHQIGQPLDHPQAVLTAVFSPDGRELLTGCVDGNARLWGAATGSLLRALRQRGPVRAVAFSSGGRTVLTTGQHRLRLWETATGRLLHSMDVPGRLRVLVLSPDGARVLTGTADGTVGLWDAATLQARGPTLPRQQGEIQQVCFGPSGKIILTVCRTGKGGGAKSVCLWRASTGERLCELRPPWGVSAVAFSPDGKKVLTGGGDYTARLWDCGTGKPVGSALRHQDVVRAVAFSPDGKVLLTGSDDRTARLWDAATGEPIGQPLEHQGPVGAVGVSLDGRALLTASRDGTARLWKGAAVRPWLREFVHDRAQVMALAWSPRGDTLATGTDRGEVRRWRVRTGECLGPPLRHGDEVWVVAFSPDGRILLTGGRDRTARLWDAGTGRLLRSLAQPRRTLPFSVRSAAFSPDGRTILLGSGNMGAGKGEARLWHVATGAPLGPPLEAHGVVWQTAFSPDGKLSAIASGDDTARLWDVERRKPRGLPLKHQNRVVALAFSPDGRTLLTGSTDQTARLWDTRTGKPLGEPHKQTGAVWAVAFSTDGRTVVTGSRGGARLWNAATGTPVGPLWPHRRMVWAAACHPRDQTVATGGGDGKARLWQLPAPMEGERQRVALWVQVLTGMELDDSGVARRLGASAWEQRRQRLAQRGGPPLP
jgi:WD40 repeat protein